MKNILFSYIEPFIIFSHLQEKWKIELETVIRRNEK